MTTNILILTLLIISGISCNGGPENKDADKSKLTVSKKLNEPPKNIRFDFSAKRIPDFNRKIEINATLFNDNADTVYFLSTTCDGKQYSLQYDTSKFVLTPFLRCNAINPSVEKIDPKGQYDFKAHFEYKMNVSKIKLGFDFYEVDKNFDSDSMAIISINAELSFFKIIHYRSDSDKCIVWADEKNIY